MIHKTKYSMHHRKCRSRGGSNSIDNISIVRDDLHRAYHLLFKNMTPDEIAQTLNETWIDKDWILIAKKKGE